ncbi:hypothetical protein [Rhodovulum sp. FJ3]|uniref:hypothetical protein n=1 Tax=Rhodovulum sp. FJ3 TaxID=3079053 RepID=UPI00293DDF68|nr:hypothetical protein [Rhodovulum sp. FJ3]MDV4167436.1 hypothetical protein [Rhodovulum sp. FJ3]
MTKLATTMAALIGTTGAALAHGGAHLHPHGSDTAWGLVLGVTALALAGAMIMVARNRG